MTDLTHEQFEELLQNTPGITLEAIVTRKDGTIEDLGEVAKLERNPITGELEQV